MASTAVPVIHRIVEEEVAKQLPFADTFDKHRLMYNEEKSRMYQKEIELSDYFLVPSSWVKESLIEVGVSPDKIYSLPHGVDVSGFTPKDKNYQPFQKLRFLFVGRSEGAKGIHYILEAFKQLQK